MEASALARPSRISLRLGFRRVIMRTLLLLAIVGAGLVLYEIGLRVYYRQPLVERYFRPLENSAGYGLQQSQQYRYLHNGRPVVVSTDELGRRVVPGAPAEAPMTLWVIGDSQVFGWGLSDSESIPARLQERLGDDWRVVNLGVPGYGPFQYAETLRKVPEHDPAVVIQTEANDFQDAYVFKPQMLSRCGYLVSRSWLGEKIPCFLLSSYALVKITELRVRLAGRLPVPSGYSPAGQAAARVLRYRIDNLYAPIIETRHGPVIFAAIPWDAAIDPARLSNYQPALPSAQRFVELPDQCGLERRFFEHHTGAELFQARDSHLSPLGAELVADRLVSAVVASTAEQARQDGSRLNLAHD